MHPTGVCLEHMHHEGSVIARKRTILKRGGVKHFIHREGPSHLRSLQEGAGGVYPLMGGGGVQMR